MPSAWRWRRTRPWRSNRAPANWPPTCSRTTICRRSCGEWSPMRTTTCAGRWIADSDLLHECRHIPLPLRGCRVEWSEELSSGLLQAAPYAILVMDAARVVLVNDQAETMFGWPRAQLLGQPAQVLLTDA